MSPRLIILSLSRITRDGFEETLTFDTGVNVIVGEQNSGKSTWLKMLDYLMLKPGAPKQRFDDVIIEKYASASAKMLAGERVLTFTRGWDADGNRAILSVDGERISAENAEALLLELLEIPALRFPQGAFTSERAWPSLGWRSMYRHIYRRQNFWDDLVSKQPESEQQAVLLQFLGLAEALFSEELALLADKRREILRAEAQKDFFIHLVQQIAPGLFPDEDLQVGLTEISIETAKARLDSEINALVEARSVELEFVRGQLDQQKGDLQSLMDSRTEGLERRAKLKALVDALELRLDELISYQAALSQEQARLTRADVAAEVFSPLRVTHCPACDQSVEGRRARPHQCFLCEQATPDGDVSLAAATRRLKFEHDQISGELAEAGELIGTVRADLKGRKQDLTLAERELERIEVTLRPFQASASQLLPEAVALLDQKVGALGARKQSLDRLFEPLRTRDAYSERIDQLRREASDLEARVSEKEEQASFEAASDWLSEGFTTYLNQLRAMAPKSWTKSGAVTVRISDRKTIFYIGGKPGKPQLGGTLTLFFAFAYHYALLDLMRRPGAHYPGLAILDTFPDIAEGEGLREPLGLVMRPFEDLANRDDVAPVQVIITARDFPSTSRAKLIRLTDIWS